MADPASMMDAGVDWKTVAVGACTVTTIVVGILVNSLRAQLKDTTTEIRRQADKLSEIERTYIDRNELHREIAEMGERVETRHLENREALRTIEAKLDASIERDALTRHDIRDAINTFMVESRLLKELMAHWKKEPP